MNKAALLIGVSEYNSESGLKPLPSAAEDVQAMQRALLQASEFTAENITVLTNPEKKDVEEAIYQLFAHRQKEDLLLFYFSGHGIKDETGKLYFSLPTTRKNQNGSLIKHTAIPATVLHENMNDSRSTCQVLVLDCCFSGAFAKGLTIKDDGSIDIPTQLGGTGRAIFTSSNSTEYSFQYEGFKLSLYTHFFVEGLETGAADLDNDGLISVDELHTYVSDKVRQTKPKMTPRFFTGEQGYKIFLARAPKDNALFSEIIGKNGGIYLTNDDVKIELVTTVTVETEDFQVIEEYLSSEISIENPTQELIKSTIKRYLKQVNSDRYHMCFYHANVNEQENLIEAKSVEQELKEAITRTLQDHFGAKVISIVLRPIETPISKQLQKLRSRVGSFQVEVLSLSDSKPIKLYAKFKVLGVAENCWYLFQFQMESMWESQKSLCLELYRLKELFTQEVIKGLTNEENLSQIKERIRLLEEELSGISSIQRAIESSIQKRLEERNVALTNIKEIDLLQKVINTWAKERVRNQYGLEIIIENLYFTAPQ